MTQTNVIWFQRLTETLILMQHSARQQTAITQSINSKYTQSVVNSAPFNSRILTVSICPSFAASSSFLPRSTSGIVQIGLESSGHFLPTKTDDTTTQTGIMNQ